MASWNQNSFKGRQFRVEDAEQRKTSTGRMNIQQEFVVASSVTEEFEFDVIVLKEKVNALLSEKFEGRMYDSKAKQEWMTEYIEKLKVASFDSRLEYNHFQYFPQEKEARLAFETENALNAIVKVKTQIDMYKLLQECITSLQQNNATLQNELTAATNAKKQVDKERDFLKFLEEVCNKR